MYNKRRIIFQKIMVLQVVCKFKACYGSSKSVTAFRITYNYILPWHIVTYLIF